MASKRFSLIISIFFASLLAPTCALYKTKATSADLVWWQKTVIYQIYPRSFMDSNGDGTGDLKGIESKLDHFADLGIGALWLSPIYKSPMKDFGYDVSDYRQIDPLFGTMEDFDSLLFQAHSRGIGIIMDFIPNHSSDQHRWFQLSRNRTEPYTDYFIWVDCVEETCTQPPNNWVSAFANSSWEYDTVRRQFYYHAFLKEQPDHNFNNPLVHQEFKDILQFWLSRGVDGFRVDTPAFLYEDPELKDEPLSGIPGKTPSDYAYLNHIYTKDYPQVLKVVEEWRAVLDSYSVVDGHARVLIGEVETDIDGQMSYYGNETNRLFDFPFSFKILLNINSTSTGEDLHYWVSLWLDNMPQWAWANWVLGNHDNHRIANRTHAEIIDAYNMLSTLIGGTPFCYYGEEIGMIDTFVSYIDSQDPQGCTYGPDRYDEFSRDPERTPMQWNDTVNAGFSTALKPWLPVNPNYQILNVQNQWPDPISHLNIYKKLVQLRKEEAILVGSVDFPVVREDVFSFARVTAGHPGYVVLINPTDETTTVDLVNSACCADFSFPAEGILEVLSSTSLQLLNTKASLSTIALSPYEGQVYSFAPIFH